MTQPRLFRILFAFSIFLFFGFSVLWFFGFSVFQLALAADFPQPTGHVNDFAQMLSSDSRQSLEQNLLDFEKETTAEVVVVTVNDLGDTYLEDYAVGLFEEWGIGKKEEDNGLLILIAKEEREMRIEVGYGLEPVVTDSRAGRIIRDQMTPSFKQGDYDQGVLLAVNQVQDYIRAGESPAGVEQVREKTQEHMPVVIFAVIIITYLASFWARSKRVWPGGLVGMLVGVFLGLVVGAFFLAVVGLGLWGFFLDWLLSKNYKKLKKSGKSTNFWSSKGGFFSGGGRSSGGGGFGGFGGGSSGGGGASGSW